MPARESPARVPPVGPGRRFSARDPASPGVACSTLVPLRARLARARRSGACHPSQFPAAHRQSASSQYPMATTARRLDSRHPSQYPEAPGPLVPRARLDESRWRWAACLPSRAERPASQPAGPGSPAERDSACPGRPPDPQRRGPSLHAQPSTLNLATASARVPIPTQARASAIGGCGTGQHMLRCFLCVHYVCWVACAGTASISACRDAASERTFPVSACCYADVARTAPVDAYDAFCACTASVCACYDAACEHCVCQGVL
jgi:hypothetical protein